MSPWNRILNYARDINRKVGTTLTTEKAKKIRKNLLILGAVLTAISGIGTIIGIYLMFSGFTNDGLDMLSGADKDYGADCPEMGEPGWFECESAANDAEFNDSKDASISAFSSILKSSLGGFGLITICGFLLSIGIILIQAGLAIVIAGEGAKFLDTAPKCPSCGDPIEGNEIYCNKCGADLRNKAKCRSCGTQNEVNDSFCRNCGNKLS